MLQQATIRASQEFTERNPAPPEDFDYDAQYRALDLMPGAALCEIQDRARLLSAAFCPDGLSGSLQVPAAERSMQVTLAADRLSRYWRGHGAPPPGGRAERPEATVWYAEAGHPLTPSSGFAAAPAVERPAARLHLVAPPVPPAARSNSLRRASGEQSGELRATIASRSMPTPGDGRLEAQKSRRLAIAGAALVKLAMAALVVAAIVRVQQYRADHPSLSAYSDPSTMTLSGMPIEPPARWAGWDLPGRAVIGAAAPAIAGHRRPD
jgi:hypothetical protein